MFALKDWEKKLFLPLLGRGLKTWVCPPYTIFLALGQRSFDHSWGKYLKGYWRNRTEGICMAAGSRASQRPGILISYCYIRNKPWGERCAPGTTIPRTRPLRHLRPRGIGSIRSGSGHSHLSSSLGSFPSTILRACPGHRDTSFVLPPRLTGPTDGRGNQGPDCGQQQAGLLYANLLLHLSQQNLFLHL